MSKKRSKSTNGEQHKAGTQKEDRSVNKTWSLVTMVMLGGLGVLAMFFFAKFIGASTELLSHWEKSEFALVAPDFEASAKEAKKVPDFVLPDRFGRKIKLSQFKDYDVLVVNIWSAGCPVCRQEIPSLTEFDERLARLDGVALLTVAIADSWDEVRNYFPDGTNLRVLFDKEDAVGNGVFGTSQYPETFILDKERRIRARFDGARGWHQEPFIRYLKSYL